MSVKVIEQKREYVKVARVTIYICDHCGKEGPEDADVLGWLVFAGHVRDHGKTSTVWTMVHIDPDCAAKLFPKVFEKQEKPRQPIALPAVEPEKEEAKPE